MQNPFGRKIRELRRLEGKSLADAAKEIGTTATYLSAIETGRRKAGVKLIRRLTTLYFAGSQDDGFRELQRLNRLNDEEAALGVSWSLGQSRGSNQKALAQEVGRVATQLVEYLTRGDLESSGPIRFGDINLVLMVNGENGNSTMKRPIYLEWGNNCIEVEIAVRRIKPTDALPMAEWKPLGGGCH